MFKCTFESAKEFKKVVDTMSEILDEVCFVVNGEGIKAISMDPSHVALVSIEIPKLAFEEYEADEHEIGVDLEAFKKIMNRAKSKDKLILELDEERNRLNIIFDGIGRRKFSMSLLDISASSLNSPDIEYTNKITIRGSVFKDTLKDAKLFSDTVSIEAKDGKFVVSAKGDLNDFEAVFEPDDLNVISANLSEDAKSSFNLEYLTDMVKNCGTSDFIEIHFGDNMPVKIKYALAGVNLSFLLAPQIEK